ncbi:TetR family transcriptional regulator [Aeromicrobium endophyticum]|uniref:TetR family transcriptional regulator n=1 Tax=Aeromicrobium endophyticum TaxID=2292704 RepID=UPI001F391B55|nr:TetR family transcriptional regulator [Aeromicrobium endophyticum]
MTTGKTTTSRPSGSSRPERQRDPERTKAELLQIATEVFAQDGYSGARVDEIAERTSTTKRMIYYYFGGKEGLYLAVLENAYQGIRAAEQGLDVTGLEPVAAIRRLAELTYDYHVEHPEFIRLVSIENIHRGEFIRRIDALRSIANPAAALIDNILSRGRDDGSIRHDVDRIDVHMMISSYCVFQVANQHTFGHLFGRDMGDESMRPHHRAMIGDVIAAWVATPLVTAPR